MASYLHRSTRLLVVPCLLLAVFASAHAADPQTYEEVLEALESSKGEIHSWSSDMVMSISLGDTTLLSLSGTMNGKGESLRSLTSDISGDVPGQSAKMRSVTDADGTQWMEIDRLGEAHVTKMDAAERKEFNSPPPP